MSEPWCWHPEQVARLTDYQVLTIREAQSTRIEAATRQNQGGGAGAPPAPKPALKENVRCGAAYEYLIGSGMTPEQAEAVIRA